MGIADPLSATAGNHTIIYHGNDEYSLLFVFRLYFLVRAIVAIFALMFTGIAVAALWFTHSFSKIESRREIQKKKREVIDKNFNEMLRI